MAPPNFNWNDDLSLTRKGMGPVPQQTPTATSTPSATPAPEPAPSDPARYKLGSRLGRSGQVYEAQSDRHPGRLVIKLMPFAVGLPGTAVRAFTHEAMRVADLRHPHVVALTAAGIMADGTPFLAMEPLTGEILEDRLTRQRIFGVGDVLPVVRGLASALAAAHAAGVFHREVRADNVFISDLPGYGIGFARLLDFGVSRLTAAARDAGRIVAPAAWRALAPEQQQGSLAAMGDRGWQELLERTDERTDQFALGALTYRLLTGIEPLAGQEVATAFERVHLKDDQTGRCPPAVDVVLCKALSRRPENRYDSMALFFRAFEEACADALASERGAPAARPGRGHISAPIAAHPDAYDDETRPAISGIEAVTRPEAPAATEAPTAVSWRPAGPPVRPVVRQTSPSSSPSSSRPSSSLPSSLSSSPNSLTQQFFADGERQEADWLKGMARRPRVAAPDNADTTDTTMRSGNDDLLDLSASFDRPDRLPRQRTVLIAAGIVVALLGLGVVGWAAGLWSPTSKPAAVSQPTPGQPPSGGAATPESPRAAPGSRPVIPPPTPAVAAPAAGRTAAAPPTPVAAPRSPPTPPPVDEIARPAEAEAAPTVSGDPAVRPEPLRGMAWSTKRRKMVRSRLAPLPSESPPPPPITAAPVPPVPRPEVQVVPGWPPPGSVAPPGPGPAAPSWPN